MFPYSIYTISMEAFRLKTLKLLADPCKLRDVRGLSNDRFKQDIECKFNCELNDINYKRICSLIADELVIYEVLSQIIDRVS